MKSAIRAALAGILAGAVLAGAAAALSQDLRQQILRNAAIEHGVLDFPYGPPMIDPRLVDLGERLFEEERLSLNGDTSCRSCHLDAFASADGLPQAIGVGGEGEGPERAFTDGAIIPRNTLPLWGRGGPGFNTFFWDGKVERRNGRLISQFGTRAPSDDPLEVAVHLPFVEIREMLVDDVELRSAFVRENVDAAEAIYRILVSRLAEDDAYTVEFRQVLAVEPHELTFAHVARAVAAFIRSDFALRDTRFLRFLRGQAGLNEQEVAGGLLFYGRGRCASCHAGPYYSDFDFHAIALPQIGFGRNGFGVDYGRFNITHDPADLYAFRTPPLINVARSAPYGHSGSLYDLADVIRAHFDPLGVIDINRLDDFERHETYRRLAATAPALGRINYLDERDIADLVAFLHTLSFDDLPQHRTEGEE